MNVEWVNVGRAWHILRFNVRIQLRRQGERQKFIHDTHSSD